MRAETFMADTIDTYAGYRATAELYAGWGRSAAMVRSIPLAAIPLAGRICESKRFEFCRERTKWESIGWIVELANNNLHGIGLNAWRCAEFNKRQESRIL